MSVPMPDDFDLGLLWMESSKYILTPGSTTEAMSISPISPINDPDIYIEHRNRLNKRNSSFEAMDETDFPSPPLPSPSAGSNVTLNKVFCCANEPSTGQLAKPTTGRGATFLARPGSAVQIITTAVPAPAPPSVTTPDGTTKQAHQISSASDDGDQKHTKVGDKTSLSGSPRRVVDSLAESVNSTPSTRAINSTQIEDNKATIQHPSVKRTNPSTIPSKQPTSSNSSSNSSSNHLGATLCTGTSTGTTSTSGTMATAASTGRISPSRSYDDMIKFVFTEHGIKVISDREYVV